MDKAKVEAILKDQGRSKKWLQEQLGMTRTTFFRFLKGEGPVKLENVKQVATALEVNMDDVI